MNTRRKLIVVLVAGALAPLLSFAQPNGKVRRVGFLVPRARPTSLDADWLGAFPLGMRELGYVEGKNLVIEWRYADNKAERLPELAAELVGLKVDAIVTTGTASAIAAQKATATIPIVMINTADPVASGLVKSLARPGGNVTGLTNIAPDLNPKHLEMLHSVLPKLTRVAALLNPANPTSHDIVVKNFRAAAQKTGVTIAFFDVRTPQEIENAFVQIARQKPGALIAMRDALVTQQVRMIAELAAKNRLPAISGLREFAEAGGLMSYGQSNVDDARRAATYVDKILKGAKPADLPIEQPTKFELVVNQKTARALGIKIPQSILVQATKVIE